MTDGGPSRERTLDEYVDQLPPIHPARRERDQLRAALAQRQSDYDGTAIENQQLRAEVVELTRDRDFYARGCDELREQLRDHTRLSAEFGDSTVQDLRFRIRELVDDVNAVVRERNQLLKTSRKLLAERDQLRAELAAVKTYLASVVQRVEADERYHYPPARVQVNAPLALIQVGLTAEKRVAQCALAACEPKP